MEDILKKTFIKQGRTPVYKEPLEPLRIITREEWGAQPPAGNVPVLKYKPNNISFSFGTRSPRCKTRKECIKAVQGIQRTDLADGQPDIDYNFLVAGDGNVYEGRGWTNRVSFLRKEPPIDNPDQTFDIGMVGDYKKEERSDIGWPYVMLTTVYRLIHMGVDLDYIERSYFFL